MTIIPAIDILNGKCVRLTKGDYAQQTIYNEDPLEVALQFEDAGLTRLHLVDLDGAKAGDVKNWKVLERIAGKTTLSIDFSGGLSSSKNVSIAFDAGAAYASVGSKAVKDEMEFTSWLLQYGASRFIIGADVKDELVYIKGWTEATTITVYELIKNYLLKGVLDFFCTDIDKDGLLEGPSTDLYAAIIKKEPSIRLIASGGVTNMNDIDALREFGCSGVIIGKAIYENRITLNDLKKYLQ